MIFSDSFLLLNVSIQIQFSFTITLVSCAGAQRAGNTLIRCIFARE
jgi:hypothetical protein